MTWIRGTVPQQGRRAGEGGHEIHGLASTALGNV